MPRRPSVPMQTMHWDAIPKEKLEKSIWASAVDTDEEIKEDDMAEIEKLFGKEEKKGPRGARDNAGGNTATADTKPKKDRLYLIDAKRAQNVTIGLSQFKSVCSYKELIRAVCSLDSLRILDSGSSRESSQYITKCNGNQERLSYEGEFASCGGIPMQPLSIVQICPFASIASSLAIISVPIARRVCAMRAK